MALPIQPEFWLTCPTERYIHRPKPPRVWLIQKSGTGYNRDSVVDPTDRNHQAYQGGPSLKLVLNINSRHTKPKYSVPFDVPTEISGILGQWKVHLTPCPRDLAGNPIRQNQRVLRNTTDNVSLTVSSKPSLPTNQNNSNIIEINS